MVVGPGRAQPNGAAACGAAGATLLSMHTPLMSRFAWFGLSAGPSFTRPGGERTAT